MHVDPAVLRVLFAGLLMSSSPRRLKRLRAVLVQRKEALERMGDPAMVERALALLAGAETQVRIGRTGI